MGRVIQRSADTRVWSEVHQGRVTVHAPGCNLTAPASMPTAAAGPVQRLRAALVFGGDADRGDLAAVYSAAFGEQTDRVTRLPVDVAALALSHVMKAWGVAVGWR